MHLQIRGAAQLSPPDVEKYLEVLERAGVNVVAAGGGSLELGGEFAFAPAHEELQPAMDALERAGYHPRALRAPTDGSVGPDGLAVCWLTNVPGQLRACIAGVAASNLLTGRVIQDMLVGVEMDSHGRIPVQVYSVEVKSQANH